MNNPKKTKLWKSIKRQTNDCFEISIKTWFLRFTKVYKKYFYIYITTFILYPYYIDITYIYMYICYICGGGTKDGCGTKDACATEDALAAEPKGMPLPRGAGDLIAKRASPLVLKRIARPKTVATPKNICYMCIPKYE